MTFAPLPRTAAWHHHESRTGFEVVVFTAGPSTLGLRGSAAAVEDGEAWAVHYDIALDRAWRTTRATVRGLSADGAREVTLEVDAAGRWRVDGSARPDLDGCLDVDLAASACTNTIPVHRMSLAVGDAAEAPAAYVRAADLAVKRLEQRYLRADDTGGGPHHRYEYSAPTFDFATQITCDDAGLVLTYPGIARRAH
jgi:hypothetical protein